MLKRLILLCVCILCGGMLGEASAQTPVDDLVERIEKGASKKFIFEITDAESEEDFFELSSKRGKIIVEGNNWVSIAVGLNWYLKYYAGVQVTRDNPTPQLNYLPKVESKVRLSTDLLLRYYLDVQSASHASAYWSAQRWQQEIDYMALHGVNMPLVTTGVSEVYRSMLRKLGYNTAEVQSFLPHPAYEGWWLDGKIEGWGAPVSEDFTAARAEVGRFAVDEMRKWGIEPVLMGYNGMMPSDSTGVQTQWNGITSPKVYNPTSKEFAEYAKVYYEELEKVYGKARYYLVNPIKLTESGNVPNSREEGEAIFASIKNAVPTATWVVGVEDANPTTELIDYIPRGELIVVDRNIDRLPEWGDKTSRLARKEGFVGQRWIYAAKVDYDGRGDMYGNISRIVGGYYVARESGADFSMVGVGVANDGVRGNDILFEVMYELPWSGEKLNVVEWTNRYVEARYGTESVRLKEAWRILLNTLYSPKYTSEQRGASQSVFAARPALIVPRVSTEGTTDIYYDGEKLKEALRIMLSAASEVQNRENFEADLVDVAMAVLSNYGKETLEKIRDAFNKAEREELKTLTNNFLDAMLLADNLLNSHPQTMVGNYIEEAMKVGGNPWQRDWLRYGARTMISSWGSEVVANDWEMHDKTHRLYGGVMADLYAKRWARFFNYIEEKEKLPQGETYYDIERNWAEGKNPYPVEPLFDAALVAREVLELENNN